MNLESLNVKSFTTDIEGNKQTIVGGGGLNSNFCTQPNLCNTFACTVPIQCPTNQDCTNVLC